LNHLYGDLPSEEFSPLKLAAVRNLMIEGYIHPKYGPQESLCRAVVNRRIGRIVHTFKWATSQELVPATVWHGLRTVSGLRAGRTRARETDPIRPVADAIVDATLPHVTPEVAAMIRLQRATGMRPGEVCILRACDIDMSGEVWLYRPAYHKLAYRGKPRVVAIGPRGQETVKPFLALDTQAYLFSPRAAMERHYAERRRNRKTPMTSSQAQRKRKRNPRKAPGEKYTTATYDQAIIDACEKAYPPPTPLARQERETGKEWLARLTDKQKAELAAWRPEHQWHPNQLRHSYATAARRAFGLEAAQVALGHSQADVTAIHAERDKTLAVRVAAAIG
jgi:integrase